MLRPSRQLGPQRSHAFVEIEQTQMGSCVLHSVANIGALVSTVLQDVPLRGMISSKFPSTWKKILAMVSPPRHTNCRSHASLRSVLHEQNCRSWTNGRFKQCCSVSSYKLMAGSNSSQVVSTPGEVSPLFTKIYKIIASGTKMLHPGRFEVFSTKAPITAV